MWTTNSYMFVKGCSHSAIEIVIYFSKLRGSTWFCFVVTMAPCEHLHWISNNLFVVIKNRTVWTTLKLLFSWAIIGFPVYSCFVLIIPSSDWCMTCLFQPLRHIASVFCPPWGSFSHGGQRMCSTCVLHYVPERKYNFLNNYNENFNFV